MTTAADRSDGQGSVGIMSPQRIQRKRIPGWRKPDGAVYVGRGSKWGNPFRKGRRTKVSGSDALCSGEAEFLPKTQQDAVDCYRNYMEGIDLLFGTWLQSPTAEDLHELTGRDLMCWCPLDEPCHADVLIELANQEG